MKQKIKLKYSVIVFLMMVLVGCDKDDDSPGTIAQTGEKRVYFTTENVEVGRTSAESFSVELRYDGPKTEETIEVPYTVSFPAEDNAIEGEDFRLPKSGTFIIEKGKALTSVVLLQEVINNENAEENRSVIFELQAKEGLVIGNTSDGGSSITVTMTPFVDPNDLEDFIGDKKYRFSASGSIFQIPYFSNRKDIANTDDEAITTAVIAVHGSSQDANGQFESITGAAQLEGVNLDTLLLIAPQFVGDDEVEQFLLDEDHVFWDDGDWRVGDDSSEGGDVSSFTIMDSLMVTLSEYPNLKRIVFTGHSAGGQFASRYAASTPIVDELEIKGIDMRFVVTNPGTYTYMDDKRKVLGTESTFEVPPVFAIEDCSDYNEFPFGLENLFPYLDVVGAENVRDRLEQRRVTYLIGQNDNDPTPEETSINEQCEAILQGRDRFERATNYFDHLIDTYGSSILERQEFFVVPGVGHSSSGMYQSEIGRRSIFRN
ncbi:hypothetical protein LV716_18280 [Flagellimonas sp. HMM57]|uniref:hypothetical protein n=1 Tax=unclassified Flagellimonas TaxID=2644544 RepID=UPI0013D79D49|nr:MULTISPECIES: hypothetical protein [unclassified Flagellimonas]UII76187.1 hypothetical protein LV716_18280 [Flagellimonas sp. HMM57]